MTVPVITLQHPTAKAHPAAATGTFQEKAAELKRRAQDFEMPKTVVSLHPQWPVIPSRALKPWKVFPFPHLWIS